MNIILRKRQLHPRQSKYKAGHRYHNYVLISPITSKITPIGYTYKQWRCLCDCGIEFVATTKQIKRGKKSCGCLSPYGRFKLKNSDVVITHLKYGHYQNGAKRRKLAWQIDEKLFSELIHKPCVYCGHEPRLRVKHGVHTAVTNGIDRIDSSLGYISGNMVPCCFICNRAKGTLTVPEFNKWIDELIAFRGT